MSRISKFGRHSRDLQTLVKDNRVFLYIRASTAEQVNSLDVQKSEAARYTAGRDLILDGFETDAGVSAVKHGFRDRPGAQRMFKKMKSRGIRTILVLRVDRAFRSSQDFSETLAWCKQQGFTFRFIDPDIDLGTPQGEMFIQIQVALAQMEGKIRSARVDGAYDSLREKRITRANQAGYGWHLGPPSTAMARKSGKPLATLIPIPAEQAVLRHIHAIWEAHQGGHGQLTAIANLLNRHRIPTKLPAGTEMKRTIGKKTGNPRQVVLITDGQWKPMTVKSVLAHLVLATDAELPDGIPTFEQAAAILRSDDTPVVTSQPSTSPAPFADF